MHNPLLLVFIKSYFAIILTISIMAICIFFVVAYCIVRRSLKPSIPKDNLCAIAGGDLLSTQLDLARAYIEINQKQLALEILKQVEHQGTAAQKREAKSLLEFL